MAKILKHVLLLCASAMLCLTTFAARVSVVAAQNTALNFYKVTSGYSGKNALNASLKLTRSETDGTIDFYVFDISPGKGFVIVSADDQVAPVIAYSTESNFNISTKGKGVQNWMNNAAAHIYRGIQRHTIANAAITEQWSAYKQGRKPATIKSAGVAPLLTTLWDQEPFYNQLCPYNNADQMRAVTGCAATAMAQIMKYWNYPAQGTGSYGYYDGAPVYPFTYGDQYANFGATTYNWAAMPNSIDTTNLAVATLMYHCGVAVGMSYGDDNQGGSGTYVLSSETASWRHSVQMAYTTYFGYNPNTLMGVQEANYSATAWVSLLENELNAGHPVQYEGLDTTEGGHTWVCDGYDENDMLHMNWGWSGFDNGYFSVSSLTADGYNFSNNEAALIGIEPISDLTVTAGATNATICTGGSTTLIAQGSGNVSYLWTPATGLSCATCATTIASPDTTTTYTVTIDSAGLSATSQVTVSVNNLHMDNMQTNNVSCFNGTNGEARVKVAGGNPGYTYMWNNGSAMAAVLNLSAGNYSVTVNDATGCSIIAVANITQPDSLTATIQPVNASCSLANASLNVIVIGGTPLYTYHWDGGEQDSVIPSVQAGVYSVTATDSRACTVAASFNLVQPLSMDVSIITSNTTCSLVYGKAIANVTGGHKNFSFQWNTGENTSFITQLSASTYAVTVTDSLGCASSASVFISQPDTMNVSIASSNAADNKVYGNAIVNVTGGTPQYSYLWNTGDTTGAIAYSAAGVYSVTITDSKGCAQVASTEISEAAGVTGVSNNLNFGVYPNPAVDQTTIRLGEPGENTTVELKNMLGQTLLSTKTTDETQLDLSSLASGTYLVELTRGQLTTVKELVKK